MKFTKKIILFTLALPTDIFMERGEDIYVPYDFFYRRLSLPKSSIRVAVLELIKDGYIEKISRSSKKNFIKKKPFFKLTLLGKRKLYFLLRAFSKISSWRNKWWLMAFLSTTSSKKDLTRANRKNNIKIKHFLEEKGFVPLQRNLYIGLENIYKELIVNGWEKDLFVTSFSRVETWTNKELAFKLWGLGEIVDKTTKIINEGEELLKRLHKKKKHLKQEKLTFFKLLKAAFYVFSEVPILPKALLPDDCPFEELKLVIGRLSKSFDDGALI